MIIDNDIEPLRIYYERLEDADFFRRTAQRIRRARERETRLIVERSIEAVTLLRMLVATGDLRIA